MSEENRCPKCGAPLPAHAPQGLCPGCLLKRGVETTPLAPEASGPASGDFTPPTPEQLAPQFPDLEILEFIGRGGMGMVYKARQKHLDRLVALKILLPNIARDPAFAERFMREARAMAMLSHPHIVTVHDFGVGARHHKSPLVPAAGRGAGGEGTASLPSPSGRGAGGEGGFYYFIMEFVDGLTLRQLLDAGKLPSPAALAIVPQICEALQYAHDKGLVHRDIKPENILMDRNGQVKIADFGLAKLVGREAKEFSLTGAGQVMGTPHYMAPEQIEHPQDVDHRADIYSLGVVFYQMLTGELPIGRFAPPSQRVQVDVRLDEVVLRALEKEPELRFQQASEVKTKLESIATTSPHTAPTPGNHEKDTRQPVAYPAFQWVAVPLVMLASVIGLVYAGNGYPSRELADIFVPWTAIMLAFGTGLYTMFWFACRARNPYIHWGLTGMLLVLGLFGAYAAMQSGDSLSRVPIGVQAFFCLVYFITLAAVELRGSTFDSPRHSPKASLPSALAAGNIAVTRSADDGMPRFSRAAIVGAAWAPLFFVMAILTFTVRSMAAVPAGGELPGPQWWQSVLMFTLLPLGLLAPFGTTILGTVAISQIRHSAGRIYGLPLALCDALLFPLLAVDVVILKFSKEVAWHSLMEAGSKPALEWAYVLVMLFAAVLIVAVDCFLVLAAWRAVREPVSGRADVPATREDKRLGFAALVLSVAALPLALMAGGTVGNGDMVLISFVLLQVIALICGIVGRRSVTGKLGICLSAFLILAGTLIGLWSRPVPPDDFGGRPAVVSSATETSGNPGGTTAAGDGASEEDQLVFLNGASYSTSLPPVNVNRAAFGAVAVLDVAPNRFQSWDLKPTDYGLPADASPEQVAATAEKGDLYLTLPAKEGPTADLARLMPLRGAILFPLELPSIGGVSWTYIERVKRMSRSQIAAIRDAFLDAHPSEENHAAGVTEGQTYALVRPDGETFLLRIGELSQIAGQGNRRLEISMFPLGRIPWGTSFCVVDTRGNAVAGATARFSITERLQKVRRRSDLSNAPPGPAPRRCPGLHTTASAAARRDIPWRSCRTRILAPRRYRGGPRQGRPLLPAG